MQVSPSVIHPPTRTIPHPQTKKAASVAALNSEQEAPIPPTLPHGREA